MCKFILEKEGRIDYNFPVLKKGVYKGMKRKFLALTMLLSVSLVFGACGKEETSESTLLSETPIVSETSASSSETETSVGNLDDEEEKPDPAIQTGGDNSALYEAFLAGTEKAEITKAGDQGTYYSFSEAMKVGESYTINEIIENLSSYMKDNGWDKEPTLGQINHEYIDCGQDGNPELHVQIELPVEDIEPFVVEMIVVAKNGHLAVAYDGDSWSRRMITVDSTGTITSGGADGAASLVFETSFVNAAGDFVFGYKGVTVMQLVEGEYYFTVPKDLDKIDLSGLSLDGLMLEEVSFEEDASVADTYILLFDGYADEEATDPSVFDASHPVRQAFENAGFKVISTDELTELTNEKMAAKGYITK